MLQGRFRGFTEGIVFSPPRILEFENTINTGGIKSERVSGRRSLLNIGGMIQFSIGGMILLSAIERS
jgi:hypothetical protein